MVDITTKDQEEAVDRKKSAGEILFDRTVYTGIGFGVNEVSSLVITDQFLHGKNIVGKWFSKEGFDAASGWLAKTFKVKDGIDKSGKKVTGAAKAGNMLLMVTLLSGGTLLILPMKWLEDHKNYWVKKANHLIDGWRGNQMSAEEVAARDAQVEQDIACSPRQSWPSMLLGRVIACCSSVATGTFLVGKKNNDRLMDWSEKTFAGSIQPEGKKNFWHRQAGLLSVETYSCAISSIVLEMMSKLFAKKSSSVHNPDLCRNAAPAPTAAATASENEGNTSAKNEVRGNYCAKIQAQKQANEALAMQM